MTHKPLRRLFYFIVLICTIAVQTGCRRPGKEAVPANLSAADKIAGVFSGPGKYLPGDISLGTTPACTPAPTDYTLKYLPGTATVNITRLTDSTITLTLLTGPFPQDKYTALKLTTSGNMISFGNLGYYDSNTDVLSFSGIAPGFSFSYLKSCQPGLPYYYSTSVIPYPGQIGHFTIKRYEFSGTKK